MNAAMRLDEHERTRFLELIGIERYVSRCSVPVTVATETAAPNDTPTRVPMSRKSAAPTPATEPRIAETKTTARRPSLIDELGLDARAPQVLVFVETPRAPDPRSVRLLDAICRLLPPHQRIDVNDLPTRWTGTAIALGGQVQAPEGTQLIQSLPLHELRHSITAKRALWQSIKRLRRGLRPH